MLIAGRPKRDGFRLKRGHARSDVFLLHVGVQCPKISSGRRAARRCDERAALPVGV